MARVECGGQKNGQRPAPGDNGTAPVNGQRPAPADNGTAPVGAPQQPPAYAEDTPVPDHQQAPPQEYGVYLTARVTVERGPYDVSDIDGDE